MNDECTCRCHEEWKWGWCNLCVDNHPGLDWSDETYKVLVELRDDQPAEIYRNAKDVIRHGHEMSLLKPMAWKEAVFAIRRQVYHRAKGECERCGKPVTWRQMHMDEKVSRGEGGHISLDNCWCLCADCHIGQNEYSEHSNRQWQTSKNLKSKSNRRYREKHKERLAKRYRE